MPERKHSPRQPAELRVRGARPPVPQMIAFIEEHREACGVEPVRRVLPFTPST